MNTKISMKRFTFYIRVGAVWLLLWIFNNFLSHYDTFVPQSINEIWRVFYVIVANGLFFEYVMPFILKKRSFILFNILIGIPLLWIHLMVVTFGLYSWTKLGMLLHIYISFRQSTFFPEEVSSRIMDSVTYQAQYGVPSIIFFGIIKHVYDYRKLMAVAQQLRIEKQEAELNYLKSQTNPHFLFNTLNNIYSLARDKSDMAPESILRLSKILRFMLYETGGEFIRVEQELGIISDYIALEKLRYDDSLRINFKHEIENINLSLPPLLLIPLVENAFKHGASETRNQPFVDIHLSVKQQHLTFVVKNSTEIVQGEKNVKENIGLSNLRRQLELLYSEYSLSVQQDEAVFTATLEINLASHV